MEIEKLSMDNLKQLTELVLGLWGDCEFDEEFENYKRTLDSKNKICYLYNEQDYYIAFLHLSSRNDFVEGEKDLSIAYVEEIYIKPHYQKKGVTKKLMNCGENWAKQKGYNQLASDIDINNFASIDFHKQIGFAETERIVCFIKDL
jgi:aminoglycoside 6'-N-acetyltransferase I